MGKEKRPVVPDDRSAENTPASFDLEGFIEMHRRQRREWDQRRRASISSGRS